MWDRFAPRLRQVVVAALDEAGRRGGEVAGPQHLVLAMARDPKSAGFFVLEQCGLPPDQIIQRFDSYPANADSPRHRASQLDESAMGLLQSAARHATRLKHEHVGTEHLAIALSESTEIPIALELRDLGLTPDAAEAAVRQWFALGMPRGRAATPWSPLRWKMMGPFQKLIRIPMLTWKIYARRSLAHPRMVSDPYPIYRWVQKHEPVRADPLAPVWVVSGYDDVHAMLRDPRLRKDPFENQRLPRLTREQLSADSDGGRADAEAISMLFLDPPNHTRVRSLFTRAFTPKTLAELRPRIEQIAAERLDRVAGQNRMDIIADLAYPLPVIVIAELLGFPPEDYQDLKRWSDDLAASLGFTPTPQQQARATEARNEIRQYFDRIVEALRTSPRDTLIFRLLQGEGEPDGLSREEIFSNSILLLGAGHETTTNLIGNGVLALLKNRDQWDLLVSRPELMDSAIEEMLRYDSPVQWTSRVTGEPIELGGKTIPAAQIVLGCVGAANRDPRKFADPDRFDIQRSQNKHLSFGAGIHFCLGAALARMEAQIALSQLVARFPRMRLVERKLEWMEGLTFRGVRRLVVAKD
jgi:cytochrome P450